MDPRVAQVIGIMEERLQHRLTIPELARAVDLSVAQLTRLFRVQTGVTPRVFLHHLRMMRARVLVERTTLPIAEIMAAVGISDRTHFARDFKRTYGFTPRTLRVQLKVSPPRRATHSR